MNKHNKFSNITTTFNSADIIQIYIYIYISIWITCIFRHFSTSLQPDTKKQKHSDNNQGNLVQQRQKMVAVRKWSICFAVSNRRGVISSVSCDVSPSWLCPWWQAQAGLATNPGSCRAEAFCQKRSAPAPGKKRFREHPQNTKVKTCF